MWELTKCEVDKVGKLAIKYFYIVENAWLDGEQFSSAMWSVSEY